MIRLCGSPAEGVSIVVEGLHLSELRAEPGQFFRWRFLSPDTWRTAHPFSLSAPPTDDRLRLTVKALGAGSAHLQNIAVGAWIVAEGPYGATTAARVPAGRRARMQGEWQLEHSVVTQAATIHTAGTSGVLLRCLLGTVSVTSK